MYADKESMFQTVILKSSNKHPIADNVSLYKPVNNKFYFTELKVRTIYTILCCSYTLCIYVYLQPADQFEWKTYKLQIEGNKVRM